VPLIGSLDEFDLFLKLQDVRRNNSRNKEAVERLNLDMLRTIEVMS